MGNRLFIGSCAGKFYALDRRSGRIIWTYDIHQDGEQLSFHGDPLVTDELIVISTDNTFYSQGVGHIYAFERQTGRVRWKYRSEYGIPSDIVRSGLFIYAVTLADELLCLELRTGRLIWRFSSGAENVKGENGRFAAPTSPAASGPRVFFGGLNGMLFAFDARSGDTAWKRSLGKRVTTTPIALEGRVYAGTSDGYMVGLDVESGRETGRLKLPASPRDTPLEVNGTLLVFLGNDRFVALDAALKKMQWSYRTTNRWSSHRPLVRDGLVLISSRDGAVVALDLNDGSLQWSRIFPDEDVRSIAGTDDIFYAGTRRGYLYAWQP